LSNEDDTGTGMHVKGSIIFLHVIYLGH